eukprot:13195465-Ditylum_brightwellii.AAC.1
MSSWLVMVPLSPCCNDHTVLIWTNTQGGFPTSLSHDCSTHPDGSVRLINHLQLLLTALCSDPFGNGPFHMDLNIGILTNGPTPFSLQKWHCHTANPQLVLSTRMSDPSNNSAFTICV